MAHSFLVSKVTQGIDIAADGVVSHDLPTNPITALVIDIHPLNDTGTFTDYKAFAAVLDAINDLRVFHRGLRIVQGSGRDLWAMLRNRWHKDVIQSGQINLDNAIRSVQLPIMFGRHLGDPDFAIPRTSNGELVIEIDWDDASAGYNALSYSIEAIELPSASPRHFFRYTTIAQTFGATGINLVDLPKIGDIYGILLFGTAGFTGTAPAPTWGRIRVLRDGVAVGYAGTDWEALRAMSMMAGMGADRYDDHLHFADLDGAADADIETVEQAQQTGDQYAYLDFDLDRTGNYAINARTAGRFEIEADAEGAAAVRVMPLEKLDVSRFQE